MLTHRGRPAGGALGRNHQSCQSRGLRREDQGTEEPERQERPGFRQPYPLERPDAERPRRRASHPDQSGPIGRRYADIPG